MFFSANVAPQYYITFFLLPPLFFLFRLLPYTHPQNTRSMSVAVRQYLTSHNAAAIAERILEFDESSATSQLAADRLGCTISRIAKSISLQLNKPKTPADKIAAVLVVAAGDAKVSNKKFKEAFNVAPKLLKREVCEEVLGHAAGGVCPYAIKEDVPVYLDASLKRFEYVFVACGTHNSVVKLTLEELEGSAQNCKGWVDVCEGWDSAPEEPKAPKEA